MADLADEEDNVFYCKVCLSLAIEKTDIDIDYCRTCGSTDIGYTSFENWERMYKEKYGRSYLNYKKE